jgi:hypothetical protein
MIHSKFVNRVACSCVVGLSLGAAACSTDEGGPAQSGAAEMQPQVFTFAPPDGTKGVRTEHRRYEVSLVGTPLRNLEEEELRWNIEASHQGDDYVMNQQLAHVMMKHDGAVVVDRDVKPGAITAQLFIDKGGNLVDVKGLEGTSRTLGTVIVTNRTRPAAERVFSTQDLKALIAARYEETLGDVVGRPTKLGSSWTTPGRPNGVVVSRTVTVGKAVPCGAMMCTQLNASYTLDPQVMIQLAREIVRDYAHWAGQAPSTFDTQVATYSMQGQLLTEAATMVNHGASLDESGKVLFSGAKLPMEIDLRGKTDITFDYAEPTASLPAASPEGTSAVPGETPAATPGAKPGVTASQP